MREALKNRLWAAFLAAMILGSLGGLLASAGCAPSPETVAALQADLAAAEDGLTALRLELAAVEDEGRAAELALAIGAIEERVELINAELADEDHRTFWLGLAEAVGLVICGLIPGGAIGIPFVRAARRATDVVFDSVAAGGGPSQPNRAKDQLVKSPRAYRAFRAWKQKRAEQLEAAGG